MSVTIVVIILLVFGVGLIVLANILTYVLIGQVNARAAPGQQFSLIFVQRRWPEILDRYRQFAPHSRLPLAIKICGPAGIVLLFVAFFVLVASSVATPT
jgi:hypothetical protein